MPRGFRRLLFAPVDHLVYSLNRRYPSNASRVKYDPKPTDNTRRRKAAVSATEGETVSPRPTFPVKKSLPQSLETLTNPDQDLPGTQLLAARLCFIWGTYIADLRVCCGRTKHANLQVWAPRRHGAPRLQYCSGSTSA